MANDQRPASRDDEAIVPLSSIIHARTLMEVEGNYEKALQYLIAVEDRYSVQHVCGLRGYNPMKDPPCPACELRNGAAPRSEQLTISPEALMHARMYAASDREAKHVSVMARELVRLSERKGE